MDTLSVLSGSYGKISSSISIIILLVMMFIVTMRLYISREKRAYLSFSLSLLFIIIEYILLIVFVIRQNGAHLTTDYIIQIIQIVAFILINTGIYQLYNRSRAREHLLVIGLIAIALLIAFLRFYFLSQYDALSVQLILFHNIWLDLYMFLLIFLGFYLIPPFIGQYIKYQIGLIVYFAIHLSHSLNSYVFTAPVTALSIVENFLPVMYYGILFIIIFERVVELLQAVYRSSITDGLTGLYNRKFYMSQVNHSTKRHKEAAVVFCDIDNFKKLNDTQGHQKGDEVLKHVARILIEECEEVGVAGRYGGEEMVALLIGNSVNPKQWTERLRTRIEKETEVTVSIGYDRYRKGISAEQWVKQADLAMYHSKKTGKNKVTAYSSAIPI
jgi:diguanylate cyclase (GGDEF)-like protein